MTKVKT